ncbi:MAG: hypothetical protein F2799_05690, partial [Actinobacteria bacterium]|nr:hypothetical protein [Actinomycetota bacterium]
MSDVSSDRPTPDMPAPGTPRKRDADGLSTRMERMIAEAQKSSDRVIADARDVASDIIAEAERA